MMKYMIFDLDDTVLDFHRGEMEYVTEILRQQNVPDVNQAMKAYLKLNKKIWENIEAGAQSQPLLNTRFSKTLALFGIEADGVKLEAQYREMLNHNYYIVPGASDLLGELKAAGITLFVGTNGVKRTQLARLHGSGLDKYFAEYFISEDIGYSKPNVKFFEPMFQKVPDLTANNTIMVGDRLQSDILGATRAGLQSIWFNPNKNINEFDFQPTYIANSYRQIEQIVIND
ncbi:YjjG family noncanonical pyrimidine nucleotidase [Companilactobacillus nantensis]|nr:YjjG family noncanonical pyrimidine nucleotidase [Companilactobacillus nantensis]